MSSDPNDIMQHFGDPQSLRATTAGYGYTKPPYSHFIVPRVVRPAPLVSKLIAWRAMDRWLANTHITETPKRPEDYDDSVLIVDVPFVSRLEHAVRTDLDRMGWRKEGLVAAMGIAERNGYRLSLEVNEGMQIVALVWSYHESLDLEGDEDDE